METQSADLPGRWGVPCPLLAAACPSRVPCISRQPLMALSPARSLALRGFFVRVLHALQPMPRPGVESAGLPCPQSLAGKPQ